MDKHNRAKDTDLKPQLWVDENFLQYNFRDTNNLRR